MRPPPRIPVRSTPMDTSCDRNCWTKIAVSLRSGCTVKWVSLYDERDQKTRRKIKSEQIKCQLLEVGWRRNVHHWWTEKLVENIGQITRQNVGNFIWRSFWKKRRWMIHFAVTFFHLPFYWLPTWNSTAASNSIQISWNYNNNRWQMWQRSKNENCIEQRWFMAA